MEVVEDIIFERGYSSPYFITNAETQIIKLENVVILLVGKSLLYPIDYPFTEEGY